jgi:rhodanese-related sulfurtransferase
MARITVAELQALLEDGPAPIIIDVRADAERIDGCIPGAVPPSAVACGPRAASMVVYCDCPDEASAAMLARKLDPAGHGNVRPLVGGFHAWKDAGLPVQHAAAAGTAARPPAPSAPSQQPEGAVDRPDLVPVRHAYAGGK